MIKPDSLAALSRSTVPRIRTVAIRIIGDGNERLSGPLALLAECVSDDRPCVRLEAVRVLALIPDKASASIAMQGLDRSAPGLRPPADGTRPGPSLAARHASREV